MIRSICQLLAAGGCAYFQVPTYFHGYRFNCNEYLSQSHEQHKIEMHAIPQSDIFEIIRSQACAVLEVREDTMVVRSEAHTSELQSLISISYAVFCLKKQRKHCHNRYDRRNRERT